MNKSRKRLKFSAVMLATIILLSTTLQGCSFSNTNQSDTVRWFGACNAILAALNQENYTRFPEPKPTAINKLKYGATLEQWWGVTDRQTADETLDWLLSRGQRVGFVEDMTLLTEAGLDEILADERTDWLQENLQMAEKDSLYYTQMYSYYEEYGENAIDAWDYCRAINLLGFFYSAGYYTKEEALNKALEIAQIMQPLFGSWDDLVDSYLRGYECWTAESSDERREVYEDLKSRNDNPYAVEYNTTLEKTWQRKMWPEGFIKVILKILIISIIGLIMLLIPYDLWVKLFPAAPSKAVVKALGVLIVACCCIVTVALILMR